jgi:hypothetical protein
MIIKVHSSISYVITKYVPGQKTQKFLSAKLCKLSKSFNAWGKKALTMSKHGLLLTLSELHQEQARLLFNLKV